jgi:hypothetical protein
MANSIFERNLLALSERNPELSSRLGRAQANYTRYKLLESRSGDIIPALLDPRGATLPLHSMIDPQKEAKRLISTVENECFLILLGLGGGYFLEAALERKDIGMVLLVEYDLNGLAELLCHIDYSRFFKDPRFRLFLDPSEGELGENILDLYQPVLYGGIRVIPLRARTSFEVKLFNIAGNAIQEAINRVSADYSVQAHFGKRWLSNIIRNIANAETAVSNLPQIQRAAVTAAGPSLSMQIPGLRKKRNELFLIATDTSLPCLLYEELIPDAVISIDCQHISYYHFMDGVPNETLLFLDLASPPLLSGLSKRPQFFSTGHPLTMYISRFWKALPLLDASGGNVCYAAISLAEQLGAREIELYGADFSYPEGISYARDVYIYRLFGKNQTRFSPIEAQASALLYRTSLSKKAISNKTWYYETGILNFYREKLEEKSGQMEAKIIPQSGLGAPINIRQGVNQEKVKKNHFTLNRVDDSKATMKAESFLGFYRDGITRLPKPGKYTADYLASLSSGERALFATILPAAAALKQRKTEADFGELIEEVKAYCISQIRALS